MIWEFKDGTKYKSDYLVSRFEVDYESVDELVEVILQLLPGAKIFDYDPNEDYERMHREAVDLMDCTSRAKSAFIRSALRRISRWGKAVLIGTQEDGCDIRIVVTRQRVLILKLPENEQDIAEAVATRIVNATGGTVHKQVA